MNKTLLAFALLAGLGLLAYVVLVKPERKTAADDWQDVTQDVVADWLSPHTWGLA